MCKHKSLHELSLSSAGSFTVLHPESESLNFVSLLITSCSEFQQSVIKLLQPLFPTFPNYHSAAKRNSFAPESELVTVNVLITKNSIARINCLIV